MKESNLSKEITQLNFILVIIYFVVIFGSTIFIQNFYVDFKLNQLQNFFDENKNSLTEDELIAYAVEQGFTYNVKSKEDIEQETAESFIQSNETLSRYSSIMNIFKQLSKNKKHPPNATAKFDNKTEIVMFATRDNLITLSLNPSITNDIVFITMVIAIFTTVIFLLMIISVNAFINRRVGQPLDKLSKYIDDIANLNETTELSFNHDDEIAKIGSALVSMEKDLNKEIVNRNELLRAITHELKTPLAHIVTLLYLHKSQTEEYADFNYTNQKIQKIIDENNELIQITLNSLNKTNKLKQRFDIEQLITSKIEMFQVYLANKNISLNFEQFEFEGNPVSINLIFNNLILNAAKYSHTFLKVSNKLNVITIENDYINNRGTGVGKTIISSLSEFENFKIETNANDGIYISTIYLENKHKDNN